MTVTKSFLISKRMYVVRMAQRANRVSQFAVKGHYLPLKTMLTGPLIRLPLASVTSVVETINNESSLFLLEPEEGLH